MNRFIGTTFTVLLTIMFNNVFAQDFVGKVLFVSGDVKVVRSDGTEQALQSKDGILNNDHLITREGVLQIKFQDGGFMSLQKHSEMKVENYRFEGSENGKESAIFSLLRGGLRALSGAIGHKRPGRYQLRTAVATIGIRGTAYSALLCQGDCGNLNGVALADGLHAKTTEGTIFVENEGGILDIPAGKAGFVPDITTVPIYTQFNPSFATVQPRSQAKSKAVAKAGTGQANKATAVAAKASPNSGAATTVTNTKSAAPSVRGGLSPATALSNAEVSNFDRFVTRANSFSPNNSDLSNQIAEPNISPSALNQAQVQGLGSAGIVQSRAGAINQSAPSVTPVVTPQVTPSLSPVQSFNPGIAETITVVPTASESVTEVLSNTNGLSLESGLNQLNAPVINNPAINTQLLNNGYSLPGNLINNPFHH